MSALLDAAMKLLSERPYTERELSKQLEKSFADRKNIDALIQSTKHEKVNVRCDATRALGELGDPKAVYAVIDMLKDEWVNVRIYAVTSLGKLGDPTAVPALIEVLKNNQENELVRAGAAAALGVLRDQRALLPLRELIMLAEELGELEDTALKAFKKIMAANWQNVPGAVNNKKATCSNSSK